MAERALQNAPVRPGEGEPVSVQHIVRSFDPCMACGVHVVDTNRRELARVRVP